MIITSLPQPHLTHNFCHLAVVGVQYIPRPNGSATVYLRKLFLKQHYNFKKLFKVKHFVEESFDIKNTT